MGEEKQAKQSAIITMVAETHIHSGVGQSTGAIDLPVARERTTHYPFIPGSGVKGAFRVWTKECASSLNVDELFGEEGSNDKGGDGGAGNLLCSDARLLLLPVRCLSDAYKWVTCPAILNRFMRDCARADVQVSMNITKPDTRKYFGAGADDSWLGLEEREFQCAGGVDNTIITELAKTAGIEATDLTNRLVIVSDKDFTWFARYALPIMARNVLSKDGNKKSENLWYEESMAPDTVMYVLFGERKNGAVGQIKTAISDAQYIQIGGNETIGQGWFRMSLFSTPTQNKGED